MNENRELTAAIDEANIERAAEVTQHHVATVEEQIDEVRLRILERKAQNTAMRDKIRTNLDANTQDVAYLARLKNKRRIFARAAFDLREADKS